MSFDSAIKKNRRVPEYLLRQSLAERASFFWRSGLNTKQIALRMSVPEYRIYNHMGIIKGRKLGNHG